MVSNTVSYEPWLILDLLPAVTGLIRDHRVIWVNAAAFDMLGYNKEEVLRLPTVGYFQDSQEYERVIRESSQVIAKGETYTTDFLVRHRSGGLFWGRALARAVPEPPGGDVLWMLADISDRQKAEEELRLSESRLAVAQAQALIGSWEMGPDFTPRYWSRQMYDLFGFDPGAGLPPIDEFYRRIHPDDLSRILEAHRQAIETVSPRRLTYRSHPQLGSERHFELTIAPERDRAGCVVKINGTVRDVTEREKTEKRLKRIQSQLESAQAQAHIGSWEYDPETGEVSWSTEMFRLMGRDPRAGAVGFLEYELAGPEECERLQAAAYRVMRTGHPEVVEHGGPLDAGPGVRWFATMMTAVHRSDGKLMRLAGTMQDITERKKSEEALRDGERRLHRLVQNSNDIIAVLDAQGRAVSLFGPTQAILGLEPEELVGEDAMLRVHPDDQDAGRQSIAEAIAHPGVAYRIEYRFHHKRGSWVPIEAVGTSWLHDPAIGALVINLRPISERKEAELERNKLQEQLQQAIKMEAIGRLAGGVAHDFNNLLTIISGNVELALGELNRADPLTRYLADVTEAVNSAASLTRQLLAFSRRQLIETKVVNLNDLIISLHKMLVRLIGEDVVLETKLDKNLGSVRIDPGQFDQVIVNLAVNARDAMPKGGRLILETTNVELDETYCRNQEDLRAGPFVRLSVTDTGVGMPSEVLSRIFEPFFTTKPKGAGTGLGLSVIFGVVRQAGGNIETCSEVGVGTTFKIYLPRTDEPPQTLGRADSPLESLRGTETILLVEDNESVRELTANILRRLGYELFVAEHGKSALRLVRIQKPAIDLLLTDLVMPEMSGRQLSDCIRELYPDLPVLYCSGYTEDTFVRHGLASEQLQFIAKPFTFQQLGLKVRQVLDEKRGRKPR